MFDNECIVVTWHADWDLIGKIYSIVGAIINQKDCFSGNYGSVLTNRDLTIMTIAWALHFL